MERLRTKTHEIKLGDDIPVTISCGIAQSNSDDTNLARDIMRRADLALYEAKSAGRDCVMVWNSKMSKRVDADDLEVESVDRIEGEADSFASEVLLPSSVWEVALARYVRSEESISSLSDAQIAR